MSSQAGQPGIIDSPGHKGDLKIRQPGHKGNPKIGSPDIKTTNKDRGAHAVHTAAHLFYVRIFMFQLKLLLISL